MNETDNKMHLSGGGKLIHDDNNAFYSDDVENDSKIGSSSILCFIWILRETFWKQVSRKDLNSIRVLTYFNFKSNTILGSQK